MLLWKASKGQQLDAKVSLAIPIQKKQEFCRAWISQTSQPDASNQLHTNTKCASAKISASFDLISDALPFGRLWYLWQSHPLGFAPLG